MKPRSVVVGGALSLLTACSPATVASERDVSKAACIVKAGELFPEVQEALDAEDEDNATAPAENDASTYRIASTGLFVWGLPSGFYLPGNLSCTGDFNRHLLTAIIYGGVIKRPAPGEVWSF